MVKAKHDFNALRRDAKRWREGSDYLRKAGGVMDELVISPLSFGPANLIAQAGANYEEARETIAWLCYGGANAFWDLDTALNTVADDLEGVRDENARKTNELIDEAIRNRK